MRGSRGGFRVGIRIPPMKLLKTCLGPPSPQTKISLVSPTLWKEKEFESTQISNCHYKIEQIYMKVCPLPLQSLHSRCCVLTALMSTKTKPKLLETPKIQLSYWIAQLAREKRFGYILTYVNVQCFVFLYFHYESFYYFLAVLCWLISQAMVHAIFLVHELCFVRATRTFALSFLQTC